MNKIETMKFENAIAERVLSVAHFVASRLAIKAWSEMPGPVGYMEVTNPQLPKVEE